MKEGSDLFTHSFNKFVPNIPVLCGLAVFGQFIVSIFPNNCLTFHLA